MSLLLCESPQLEEEEYCGKERRHVFRVVCPVPSSLVECLSLLSASLFRCIYITPSLAVWKDRISIPDITSLYWGLYFISMILCGLLKQLKSSHYCDNGYADYSALNYAINFILLTIIYMNFTLFVVYFFNCIFLNVIIRDWTNFTPALFIKFGGFMNLFWMFKICSHLTLPKIHQFIYFNIFYISVTLWAVQQIKQL